MVHDHLQVGVLERKREAVAGAEPQVDGRSERAARVLVGTRAHGVGGKVGLVERSIREGHTVGGRACAAPRREALGCARGLP